MNTPTRPPARDLDALLNAVPRDVPLVRDLWPGIEAAIAPPVSATGATPARARWPLALAAGLVIAALGGVVGSRLVAPPTATSELAPRVAVGEPDTLAVRSVETREADYNATRAELVRTYEERLKMLSPLTRARIAADLATIRRAEKDLRDALGTDPSSRVLLRLYESTTRQEFDLYTTVGRNTEPAAQRTRT
jgi:hypothetical protein